MLHRHRYLLFYVLLMSSFNAQATTKDQPPFEQCKARLHQQALAAGLSSDLVAHTIQKLTPIERVITSDRGQPEFTESFMGYISKRVSTRRIEKGKQLLQTHKKLLNSLTDRYGIPARYLVAFWGLETNFGGYKGNIDTLNALATLACDQRRSAFFTQELLHLLTLIEKALVQPEHLTGSWAGAMGHMQFMPSTLITYGIDADKDGQLNVWHSLADALTSAAHYLNTIGWNQQEIWGRQVLLPKHFDFSRVNLDTAYPLSHFKQLGVTKTYQRPLPNVDIEAKLLMPSGHTGPAFLVYQNFSILMRWNYSHNYALAVGLLADKLVGINHKLNHYSKAPYAFTNEDIKKLQQALLIKNYNIGKPDGIWGAKTRAALRQFQLEETLIADGFPNQEVFSAFNIELSQKP